MIYIYRCKLSVYDIKGKKYCCIKIFNIKSRHHGDWSAKNSVILCVDFQIIVCAIERE